MKNLKNILIYTKEFNHEKISKNGGTGVFYKNLAIKLKEKGYNVFVFGSSKTPVSFIENDINFHFVRDYFKKNILIEFFRSISKRSKIFKHINYRIYLLEKKYLLGELRKYILDCKEEIHIIETHDWDGIAINLGELKIPYVIRFHGSWSILEKYFGYGKSPYGKLFCESKASEVSKNNIVISKYSKKINQEIFSVKNPKLIYNGIDSSIFKNDKQSDIIPRSIFYLGNISEQKGARIAVESFIKIKKKYPDSSLHFIGEEGSYKKKILDISIDLVDSIYFYGRKQTSEIIDLIQKAEVVHFPSKGENFSLSLLEVMSIGKAVVCSDIPSFKEIIIENENGMIAKNIDEFYEKTELIFLDKNLRNQLENKARKTIVDNFDINLMINQTIEFYQKII